MLGKTHAIEISKSDTFNLFEMISAIFDSVNPLSSESIQIERSKNVVGKLSLSGRWSSVEYRMNTIGIWFELLLFGISFANLEVDGIISAVAFRRTICSLNDVSGGDESTSLKSCPSDFNFWYKDRIEENRSPILNSFSAQFFNAPSILFEIFFGTLFTNRWNSVTNGSEAISKRNKTPHVFTQRSNSYKSNTKWVSVR